MRLKDTVLGTSHLGSITRNEVVHCLCVVQFADGGKYGACIAGEENDILWVGISNAGNLRVANVFNGVAGSRILGQCVIVVVNLSAFGIEYDVLKNGSEANGVENIRFLLCRQANTLGVAPTLDVENTCIRPAVLIVTDQISVGVGRKGSLSSPGKSEEDSDISVLALIGRRVKGENVVLDGHFIKENGENTLLHLTGILSTKNDHLFLGKVDGN